MAEQKPKFSFNYKDLLGLAGLGLLGLAIHRLGGMTADLIYGSTLLLTWSGLLNIAVKYVEFHVVNSFRLIFHKMENVPTAPISEK